MYQQISLIGNLGNDPELHFTNDGTPYTRFRLAVNKVWNDQSGERQQRTTWFSVTVWRGQAEACALYLTKGRQVMVVGEMEDAYGYMHQESGEIRAINQVRAAIVKFLGSAPDHAGQQDQRAPAVVKQEEEELDPANIPF